MAEAGLPTPELLRQLLDYDPETGVLTWRERSTEHFKGQKRDLRQQAATWNTKFAGQSAGSRDHDGYLLLSVFNQKLKAHRVAWCIFHGSWPSDEIDHVNHIKDDNRLLNLRPASHAGNHKNQPRRSDNISGCTGVTWRTSRSAWQANIQHKGKRIHLGLFVDLGEAKAARRAAEIKYGYHQNHGC